MQSLEERFCSALERIEKRLAPQPDINETVAFNTIVPFTIRYKNRKYLFVYSPNTITLTIEEYGSVVVPANTWTNLNAPDGVRVLLSAGNQLVLLRWTNAFLASQPLAVAQTLSGNVLSATNAEPNISNIQQLVLNGQAFSCSTDLISAAANQAGQLFFPNTNTKNILIWSIRVGYTNANQYVQARYVTAADANIIAGTSVIGNVLNLKGGGASPTSGATMFQASVAAPAASGSNIPMDADPTPLNGGVELLAPGEFRFIPPLTAGGIAVYHHTTATGQWVLTYRWVEF